jgi:hypothetical protein
MPCLLLVRYTLELGLDVGKEINIGPGKFGKNNKHRALNKRRAGKILPILTKKSIVSSQNFDFSHFYTKI